MCMGTEGESGGYPAIGDAGEKAWGDEVAVEIGGVRPGPRGEVGLCVWYVGEIER